MPPSTAESARARKSIESDFPIIAVPISVTTTMNQFTAALGIPNRDSTRKGAALIIETSGPEDEVVKVLAPLTTPIPVLEEGLAILDAAIRGEAQTAPLIAAE
jgi:hypothetical protein